ncbi:MAG TPA: hypothetical protein PLP05_06465 [Sedimentisphaerales bacterium]|nr:hypothetical protein [Sedimentisphaerales bacterium]
MDILNQSGDVAFVSHLWVGCYVNCLNNRIAEYSFYIQTSDTLYVDFLQIAEF